MRWEPQSNSNLRFGHLYSDQLDELSRLAEESSLPTHASEQCVSACRYLATVLAGLIHGEDRDEVLSPDWKLLKQLNAIKPLHPLIQEIAQGSFRQKQPPAIEGSGWVVKSLEASQWAFHNAETFEEAVLRAVNLGDDADTTGAICGQLAGAYWGESGIPESLRSGLARMDMIEEALEGGGGGVRESSLRSRLVSAVTRLQSSQEPLRSHAKSRTIRLPCSSPRR